MIALLIAVPLSIATAVYLTELAPQWLRQPLTLFIELLAAVPSVILGLWGIFVMVPWLREHLFPVLKSTLGFLPLFQGPIYGVSMLAGGIIIAIMIVPIITSVSREILRSVQRIKNLLLPDVRRSVPPDVGDVHEVPRVRKYAFGHYRVNMRMPVDEIAEHLRRPQPLRERRSRRRSPVRKRRIPYHRQRGRACQEGFDRSESKHAAASEW